jgi:hypothetical protein
MYESGMERLTDGFFRWFAEAFQVKKYFEKLYVEKFIEYFA